MTLIHTTIPPNLIHQAVERLYQTTQSRGESLSRVDLLPFAELLSYRETINHPIHGSYEQVQSLMMV